LTPDDQEAAIMAPLINTFGSLGGIFGPILVGYIHEKYGSYRPALLFLAGTELIATVPLCYCLMEPEYAGRSTKTYKQKRAAIH
jgi:cyanate permease